MQQSITCLLAIIVLFGTSGCSEATPPVNSTPVESVAGPDNRKAADIVTSANKLQQKAVELGHAWRTTNDHIGEAEKLLAAGEMEAARSTALRAELSATASIDQAYSEQSAWQGRFPK